jgi:NAD(P)H dehydrogenase (quinone)
VAAQLGADVTIIDRDGLGGSAVLTDCVPSKALLATSVVATAAAEGGELGVLVSDAHVRAADVSVELPIVNERIKKLASAQSADIASHLERDGVRVVTGSGRLDGAQRVTADLGAGREKTFDADVVLIATGARPRVLPEAIPDGERILTWEQVYDLPSLPERLIVVGSGVTGAEFASAYNGLGADVVLVSSRERVLPGEDPDAAQVLEDVFRRRGMTVLDRSRASAVRRTRDGVVITLADGRTIEGSHCLMAVGSIPNTQNIGLESAGVVTDDSGFIQVDRVSRTNARGVYAAGDCTGVLMLASVAAMQGRIAMWHALGDAVHPLLLNTVSSNVFTDPEIATVGVTQRDADEGRADVTSVLLPLATNARAKMQNMRDGFVKLFAHSDSKTIVGGVVVAPRASELIFPVALAVEHRLRVEQIASTFTIYPSLSGSIAEAARRLHSRD